MRVRGGGTIALEHVTRQLGQMWVPLQLTCDCDWTYLQAHNLMPFPKCVALVVCVFQTSPDACSIFCLVCVWITHWLSQIIVLLHRHFLLLVLLRSILFDSKPEVPPSSSSFLQGNSQYVMSWSHNTHTHLYVHIYLAFICIQNLDLLLFLSRHIHFLNSSTYLV